MYINMNATITQVQDANITMLIDKIVPVYLLSSNRDIYSFQRNKQLLKTMINRYDVKF